jgi:uncharacterized BrkB/YihY/UPF0761 family membrane protein
METRSANLFFGRRTGWLALVSLALVGLTIVIIPVWIVQPFKPQTDSGLKISYVLRRWSPLVTIIASAAALILVIWLFPGARRWWRKAALVVIVLPLLAVTWFARQNHFEWMFHPLAQAAYAKTSAAGFVEDTDMVLAVENKGEAVAYPVRQMAYHHLAADVVGGTPIVATY